MGIGFCYQKWKVLSRIFLCGMFAGCASFHFFFWLRGSWFLDAWVMAADDYVTYSVRDMWLFVRNNQIWLLAAHLLVVVLGFFSYGRIFLSAAVLGSGFLYGAVETIFWMELGVKNMVIHIGKVVIGFGIEIVVMLLFFLLAYSRSCLKREYADKNKKWKEVQWKKYIICVIAGFFVDLLSICLCSYVN